MTQLVQTDLKPNGVMVVTLNRPEKHNAINLDMFIAIKKTIKQIAKNRSVRAVIVTGSGSDFCTGLDVKSVLHNIGSAAGLLFKLNPWSANGAQIVSQGWRKLPVPVIMAIQGRCWGGGLQIALGGDFRLVQTESTLSIMEGRYGLIPDMGGNLALKQIMPVDQAMKLAMIAEIIDAESALKHGLVTGVYHDPMAEANQLAEQLVNQSPDALAAVKKLYLKQWDRSDASMLWKETWYQIRMILGKNQRIATARSQGKSKAYKDRQLW